MSAPASITVRTSSASRAKSADRMLAAMRLGAWHRAIVAANHAPLRCGACLKPQIRVQSRDDEQVRNIVAARSTFVPDHRRGRRGFVFAYTITITNTGSVAARLISRHC